MRKFEKVTYDEFSKSFGYDKDLYDSYNIPVRKTKDSAGYDFELIRDYILKSGDSVLVPLGIKADMNEGEFLMLVVRSSIGTKKNVRLQNQMGIIDKDYYDNSENEGHMFVKLQNHGKEDVVLKKGEGIVQGIFMKFLTTDDEELIITERTGGFGSTTKQ